MKRDILIIVVVSLVLVINMLVYEQAQADDPKRLTVDVVPDFSSMSWVDIDGSGGPPAPANFPSTGEPFMIEGEVFAKNTTTNPIGIYLCRGWFIRPHADGHFTYVSQSFEIDGKGTIFVQGNERVEGGRRAIVGATGDFRGVGQAIIEAHPNPPNPISFRVTFIFRKKVKVDDDAFEEEEKESESDSAVLEGDSKRDIPAIQLGQNYPNPFNPDTEITFNLPGTSNVVVKIFNALGQEVRTLRQGEYGAGSYTLRWDGKDNFGNAVASGVYVYRLEVEDLSVVKKMNLIR